MSNELTLGRVVKGVVTLGFSELIYTYMERSGGGSLQASQQSGTMERTEDRKELHHVEVHTVTKWTESSQSAQVVKK